MNGLLIADKPAGITSHDAVARVRRITGERSIGHLGTLDPMATGVLPLLLGRWTRLAQFFGKMEKRYTGAIRFGFATATYDAQGDPLGEEQRPGLDLATVRRAAAEFAGVMEQTPPAFSAKKVGGRSAHTLARRGVPVTLEPVRVTIHAFTIDSVDDDVARFTLEISAGGYARSVAHDLGQRLGCGAHLVELRRTAAGPFTLEEALSLEQIEALGLAGELEARMPHPRTILPAIPCATADAQAAGRLRNGGAANLPEYSDAELVKIFAGRRDLVGIGRRMAGTLFQPLVILG